MTSSSDDLDDLRAAVRDFLTDKSGEEAVRAAMETPDRFDPAVWTQLADQLRLPGLAIPEEFGGDGFGLVELCVVLEELGRALACVPFFSSAVLAAHALLASGDQAACARYLPEIAAGRLRATLAVADANGAWTDTVAAQDGRLTGHRSFVIDGTTAELLLVLARTPAGPSLFAVDRDAPGLRTSLLTALDATRALARIDLDNTLATPVGSGDFPLDSVLDIASVCLAAEQAGGARRCLEMSAEYATTRFQFGRRIGTFQAVKHKCADMLVQVELAGASVREAARLHDEQSTGFPAAATAAHACCSRAFLFAALENIQVHGGIGFTWEHPAHLYVRRAKTSQLLLGGPGAYHERLLHKLGI